MTANRNNKQYAMNINSTSIHVNYRLQTIQLVVLARGRYWRKPNSFVERNEARVTLCTFYFETDDLNTVLLKATLQRKKRREKKQNTL